MNRIATRRQLPDSLKKAVWVKMKMYSCEILRNYVQAMHINEYGLHNLSGPAINHGGMVQFWTFGLPHCLEGPALFYAGSRRESRYYMHGVLIIDQDEILTKHFQKLMFVHKKICKKNKIQLTLAFLKNRTFFYPVGKKRALLHVEKTLETYGLTKKTIRTIMAVHSL